MDLCLFTVFNRERKERNKEEDDFIWLFRYRTEKRASSADPFQLLWREIYNSVIGLLFGQAVLSLILIFWSRRFLLFFLLFYGWRTITDGTVTIVRMHRRLNLYPRVGGSWNDDTWTRRLNRTWWSAAFNLISVMTRGKRWNRAYFCR